jgi:K+ transporter
MVSTVKTEDAPRVADDGWVQIEHLGASFWWVAMLYGRMSGRTSRVVMPSWDAFILGRDS